MNALYYLNKGVGILFAVGLTGLVGYQVHVWHKEAAHEAGRRLQHRVQQVNDETALEFQKNAPKWPEYKFSAEALQGLHSSTLTPAMGQK